MRCNYCLLILLFATRPLHMAAQLPEYNQQITKSFHIAAGVSVEISNKYGKVQVLPWEKDSVRFTIDMRIRAKDAQKLEKMKQNVEFDFIPGQYYIVARTTFGDGSSDVFKDLVDIAASYISPSNSVSINYTVMVPAHATLKVENKFGDVYLEDHSGAVNLQLSYGDFKANRLNGRTEMKLTSGDADVGYIKEGNITVSYGNVRIREASRLTMQSLSTVLTMEKLGTLKLNSRRDKVYLTEVNNISGESYFSVINLGTLNNEFTFSSRYGDIIVDEIRRSFSLVNITSELTDISLSFERPLVFGFELTHHQAVTFVYPNSLAKLLTKVIIPEEKIFSTSGNFGTGADESRVILKAMRKSSVTISQR